MQIGGIQDGKLMVVRKGRPGAGRYKNRIHKFFYEPK